MANSFYTAYKAVFSAVKAALDFVPAVPGDPEVPASGVAKTVFVGENFALTPDTPVILVDASSSPIAPLAMGSTLKVTVRVNLLVLVRESAPSDWFDGIIDVMGDVVDAILADRTLNGAVKDIYPTSFSPGSISYRGKTFYGGQVTLEGVIYFKP
ncbi:MAG: hypothetical protein IAX22_00435 [Candidatus Bathyarchaeota archaeon]|nr:hypothetical protein [Candidatus Bathyarchaeota archaeon]